MVFVFPPYIRKFSFYFQFQVNSTSDGYTGIEHVKTKLCMKYFTKIPLPLPIRAKHIFPILSMLLLLFFFFSLNSRNSITVVPIDIKLGI